MRHGTQEAEIPGKVERLWVGCEDDKSDVRVSDSGG